MAQIYAVNDGRDQLVVGGRHVKPITDELLVSVHHAMQQHSVVLARQSVRYLHAALGRWLNEGWPDVPITTSREADR